MWQWCLFFSAAWLSKHESIVSPSYGIVPGGHFNFSELVNDDDKRDSESDIKQQIEPFLGRIEAKSWLMKI